VRLALPTLVLAAAFLAACSKPAGTADPAAAASTLSPARKSIDAAAPAAASSAAAARLAITRHVQVELPGERIEPLYQALQAACAADAADGCVVLRAAYRGGSWIEADLTLRAAPAGVQKLLAQLHGSGGVAAESMVGEDLAAPIVDGQRRIAMTREYRDSLVALRDRQGTNIDALIRINQELAQAQSQLEAATGESAHLQQRVDTQVLTVKMTAPGDDHRPSPVAGALRDFGRDFGQASAAVITFVAWALPWLVLVVPVAWGVRAWRARVRARRAKG